MAENRLYVHSSIAIILMGKRELVVLLNLSSGCLMMVEWLFLAVPWGCLRFVIVVFPDHTHLLFFKLLGINFHIELDQMQQINFNENMQKIRSLINLWNRRYLTPLGKITVIKHFNSQY